jgi:hypothetical protein
MSVALVQSNANAGSGSFGANVALTLGNFVSSVTAGNFLFISGRLAGMVAPPTSIVLTDTAGNLWNVTQWLTINAANYLMTACCANAKAGATTISITANQTFAAFAVGFAEYSGVKGVYTDILPPAMASGTSTTATPNAITTTGASDLALMFALNETTASPAWTAPAGYTARQPTVNNILFADKSGQTAATITPSATAGFGSVNWFAWQMALFGAATLAQSQFTNVAATPTTLAGGTSTAGNFLVLFGRASMTAGSTFKVSDTLNNFWEQVFVTNHTGFNYGVCFVAPVCNGGANTTVTITSSAGSFSAAAFVLGEYSGVTAAEAQTAMATGSSTTFTSNSLTTAATGDLMIASAANETVANPTWTPTTGGYSANRTAGQNNMYSDNVNGASGAQTMSATIAPTVSWEGTLSAFLPAVLTTFSISGNAGHAGVQVQYTGPSSGSVNADGSGNYTIPNLANGTYNVRPNSTAFTFSPTNQNVTISGANQSGINFTATAVPGGGDLGPGYDFKFRL